MKVAPKYANKFFRGMSMMTFTKHKPCKHMNGWYVTVPFWVFKKRIFVCCDCGHHRSA